ncbi:DUF6928 family protein [Catenuloplanes atrovinosus]|uniref:Uncharacterized protein n=1 Tax=Catenuloplanes atrovinosus TaxID=137266 RepID=A0AAE3YUZ3_9ACTN|nr:hypothetical protein [Catenuloplanes atrovinosus]MDR7279107.1 hypothetical protein [Catenuloplanes atrovinosus]
MGVQTALLAIVAGDPREALRGAGRGAADAEESVRGLLPGRDVSRIEDGALADRLYPPDDVTYAAVLRGAVLLSDRRFALDCPSRLPAHVLRAGADRRIIVHGMDEAAGWSAFGVWEHGALVRSFSVTSRRILENIGDPYGFEYPVWHDPIALGTAALRTFFGFAPGTPRRPGDVHAATVLMHGFRVEDPLGREQATRQAMRARTGHSPYRRPVTAMRIAHRPQGADLAR